MLIFGFVTVLLAAAYLLLVPRTAVVEGRVVLQNLDGEDTPGAGAGIAVYSADSVDQALQGWLKNFEESRASNRLELQAARRVWTQLTARRDEAARILRAAERANSADLEICRARHREAAADAEDALRRLQTLEASLDEPNNPVRFLQSLALAQEKVLAAVDGSFRMEIPADSEVYLVAQWTGEESGLEKTAWLKRGRFGNGEKVQFSNANVLTVEKLAELAREAAGKLQSPAGSPAAE